MAKTERNTARKESGAEDEAKDLEAAEAAPEREMTAEEAEREVEELREQIADRAEKEASGFAADTAGIVTDAEAKAGEPMSPDEKAGVAAIEDRAQEAKAQLIEKVGAPDAGADVVALENELRGLESQYKAAQEAGDADEKARLERALQAKTRQWQDARAAAELQESPWEQAQREAEEANAALTPEQLAERQREFSEAAGSTDFPDALDAEGKAEFDAITDEDIDTFAEGIKETGEGTEVADDGSVAAELQESPWEQAQREAEAANAALTPEQLAERQREFKQAIESDEGKGEGMDAEGKAAFESITDEDIDKFAEGIKEHEEGAGAEAGERTEASPDSAEQAAGDVAAEGITDGDIEDLAREIMENDPEGAKHARGFEGLKELAAVLIAAEGLKELGELKERMGEEMEKAKSAAKKVEALEAALPGSGKRTETGGTSAAAGKAGGAPVTTLRGRVWQMFKGALRVGMYFSGKLIAGAARLFDRIMDPKGRKKG